MNLEDLSLTTLKKLIRAYNLHTAIKGYSKLKKHELIAEIRNIANQLQQANKKQLKSQSKVKGGMMEVPNDDNAEFFDDHDDHIVPSDVSIIFDEYFDGLLTGIGSIWINQTEALKFRNEMIKRKKEMINPHSQSTIASNIKDIYKKYSKFIFPYDRRNFQDLVTEFMND